MSSVLRLETVPGIDIDQFQELLPTIQARLSDFSNIPTSLYPRELLLCILTPQSNPYHAEHAVQELEKRDFFADKEISEGEVAEIFRSPSNYVRFHKVKAARALLFRQTVPQIVEYLSYGHSPQEEREFLVKHVCGYGYKEASHALRNIGRRGLSILDRHILRNLVELRVLSSLPSSMSTRRYLEIEELFRGFCLDQSLDMDELDLYFWWKGAGTIFK